MLKTLLGFMFISSRVMACDMTVIHLHPKINDDEFVSAFAVTLQEADTLEQSQQPFFAGVENLPREWTFQINNINHVLIAHMIGGVAALKGDQIKIDIKACLGSHQFNGQLSLEKSEKRYEARALTVSDYSVEN